MAAVTLVQVVPPARFFQLAFSATSTTIISGAMAERLYLSGYVFFCFFMCSFIYPVKESARAHSCILSKQLRKTV